MEDTQVTSYFEANLNRSQFLSPLWPPFLILTHIGLQNLLTVFHSELQPVPTLWSFRGNIISRDFRLVYPIPLTPLLHVNLLPQAHKVPNHAAHLPPDSIVPAYFPISVSGLFLLPATQANILELTFESSFSHTPHWIHQEITTALPSKCICLPRLYLQSVSIIQPLLTTPDTSPLALSTLMGSPFSAQKSEWFHWQKSTTEEQ